MVEGIDNCAVRFDRLPGCWATTLYRVTVGSVCGLWGEAFSHNGWIVDLAHREIDTEELYSEGDHVHWDDVWLKVKVDGKSGILSESLWIAPAEYDEIALLKRKLVRLTKNGRSEELVLVGCFE